MLIWQQFNFVQVTGVGACGRYRLPRTKEEEQKEIAEERKIKKEKEEKDAQTESETAKEDAPEKQDTDPTNVKDNETEHANSEAVDMDNDVVKTTEKKLKAKKKQQKPKSK